MLYQRNIDFANVSWDVAFKALDLFQHISLTDGSLPDWLIQLRKERLAEASKDIFQSNKKASVRAANCNRWIKKNNYYTGGIRKRKPEALPPKVGMARPANLAQYQRHSLQLISRVLNIRTNASPFTLILDDLNQRAMPLVGELVRRGLSRNVNVVVVSFEATRFHPAVRSVPAYRDETGEQILQNIRKAMSEAKESLVVVDSLYELLSVKNVDMGALFNLVAGEFASTLIGVYHQDTIPDQDAHKAYAPQPLDLFKYMATTVITCRSFAHVLAAKAARERSLPEPSHGLLQGAEGVVQCLDANDHRGIVIEVEFRRKSGRPESETYFLRAARQSDYNSPLSGMAFGTLRQEFVTLLEQVPAYSSNEVMGLINAAGNEMESTFNLGLTEKQKQAREGVVLPYFDAQKGEGAGEGGRILYDMGEEDDFDEEEDEI
jgi:elongator complex protein 5